SMTERTPTSVAASRLAVTKSTGADEVQTVKEADAMDSKPRAELKTSAPAVGQLADERPERSKRDHGDRETQRPREIAAAYREFRQLADRLVEEVEKLDEHLKGGIVADEGLEAIVEIEQLLEGLYDCSFSEDESLKRVIVAIESQINNAA